MAIGERLSRYGAFATFLAKYGRADFVKKDSLEFEDSGKPGDA